MERIVASYPIEMPTESMEKTHFALEKELKYREHQVFFQNVVILIGIVFVGFVFYLYKMCVI